MSAITAKASRKMKKYAVLTREPRCFLGSFDFSWEQRKFSELVQIERGGSPRPIDDFITDAPNGLNWVKIGDAPTQGNYITKTAEKIRPEGLSKTREVHPGDLILSNSMSFGKPYIMGIDGCIHDGWLLIRNTYGVFDLTFLCHLLGTPQMLGQYRSLAAGSTVNNLNKELVGNTVVTIPSITEQRVLGDYLEQLDHLITLHQRKCALLFSSFQALISMMFTTSTFSWEQRKLGDIGKARSGVGFPDADQGGLTGVPFFKVSDMNSDGNENEMTVANNYVTTEQIADHRWSPITELPAIFFAKVGAAVMLNRKRLCRFPFLLDNNTMAYSLSPTKWDADFAKALFGTVDLTSLVQVGALPSYNAGDVESMEIYLPSLLEQEQIGAYFKHLDNLITLHQRKCISFTGRAGRLISTVNKKRITSSWEQRKLGDIGETYTGLSGKTKADFGHGQARFVTYMNVFSNPISNPEMTEPIEIDPKQNEVEVGDVFFTTSSETPEEVGMSSVLLEKRGKTYLNSFCFGFRPSEKIDSYYLAYMLRSESAREKIILLAQGISRYNISKNKVMEIAVSLPSLDEQKLIGQYFRQLDNLITLHQRKPFLMKWRTSDANRNQTNRLVL